MDREYLKEVCHELLAPACAEVFTVQVARVLCRLASDVRLAEISKPQDVVRAFQSKGLIPPMLVYLCGPSSKETDSSGLPPNSEVLALCFAASAYPQRPYRMDDREIRLRVEAFARFHHETLSFDSRSPESLSRIASSASLRECLSERFSADEILFLISDLCAGESVANLKAEEGHRQRDERLAGAVLYLATCSHEMIRRTYEPWTDEARFVRYFRTCIYTSPSEMTGEGDALHPDWRRVRSRLAAMFPDEPHEMHDQAVRLEQTTRNRMIEYTPEDKLTHRIAQFWQPLREKLISGFPYYAFRSRFAYWWKECVATYKAEPIFEEFDEKIEARISRDGSPAFAAAHAELSPEELRLHREGYRLVRTTFFPRRDRKPDEADIPVDDAYENERLRMALDEIWYYRIQTLIEGEIPHLTVKQIVARQPFLNETSVHVLTHRIRLRMWAYTLARLSRLTNDRIRSAKRVSAKSKDDTPLVSEAGVETIASLARMIPTAQTLLLAFTAHIFMHPKVVPQRPNPLQFRDYIRELWWWVTTEHFDDAVKRGADTGSSSHKAALRALHEEKFERIIKSLRNLKVERELDLYLSGRDFAAERTEATRFVDRLLRGDDVYKNFGKQARDWRTRASQHWIVPIWYLKHFEGLRVEELLPRLIVDDREARSIVDLYHAMNGRH